jgi:aryl-alcohol dehydrogenase-like predicted oxidoreductase
MEKRRFGNLGDISSLTLGGGGTGQVWGPTSQQEAVATVKSAVDWGITFLDAAPSYGDGKAEDVIGEAFSGRLPNGVRVSTKCRLGNPPPEEVLSRLQTSLNGSLARMKLERVDLFFLHNMIIADGDQARYDGTPRTLFVDRVIPAFERLREEGRIGAWGITGIGVPSAILETMASDPRPQAIQVITNLLDSAGALQRFDGPARPREIAAAAQRHAVGVMGIRAVQAGALASGFDRRLPDDHPDTADFRRAEPFRELSKELGESPAALAHRYALSMDGIATVVLGVKNRTELRECVEAEAKGPLAPEIIALIDDTLSRS